MTTRRARGFTLLELLIAIAVMMIAVAAATTLMLASVRLTRDVQGNAEAAERARTAMAELMDNTSRVMGAFNGVRVVRGGTIENDLPLFGYDGTTGAGTNVGAAISDGIPNADGGTALPGGAHSDDLWLIVPSRQAFGEECQDVGAKVGLNAAAPAGQQLPVFCTSTLSSYKYFLVTTQFNCDQQMLIPRTPPMLPCGMGALITAITPLGANSIDFSERTTNPTIPPDPAGFHKFDEVLGVTLIHYYIAKNPADLNHPALWRGTGTLADDGKGRPFSNDTVTNKPVVEMPDIEDLQFAFGTDLPVSSDGGHPTNDSTQYTWVNGLTPVYFTGTSQIYTLKAMRLTIVARSHQIALREGTISPTSVPMPSENHNPTNDPGSYWTTPDGYERVVFSRVMALPNMAPWNL